MKWTTTMARVMGVLLLAGCGSEVLGDEGSGGGAGGGAESGGDPSSATGPAATGAGPTTAGVGQGSTSGQGATTGQGGAGQGGAAQGGGEGGAGQGGAGEGGAASDLCVRTARIEIVSVELDEEGWLPGEDRLVRVTLESPEDHLDYPGIQVTSNNPYVWTGNAQNFFFGLMAGEPNTLDVGFHAEDFLEVGTPVRFDVQVIAMNEVCEGTATATLDVTLE